jgi:exopolysaccharide biosynthesis polyprenyl glycosylphosphotransferase
MVIQESKGEGGRFTVTRSFKASLTFTGQLLDLAALGAAFLAAAAWASPGSVGVVSRTVAAGEPHVFVSLAVLLASWSACLWALWLSRAQAARRWAEELMEVVKAVSLCTLILSAAELALEWHTVNKRVLVCFWLLATVLLSAERLARRALLRRVRAAGRDARRVVIVGTGARARRMERLIAARPELGYTFVGFIAAGDAAAGAEDVDADGGAGGHGVGGHGVGGRGVIGRLDRLGGLLAASVVDEMIVALPVRTFYEEIEFIVRVAAEQGITVRVLSDLFAVGSARAVAEQLDTTPVLSLYTGPDFGLGFALKQVMDFAGALALSVLFAPLMLAVAALVKLTSPGPVFFVQERLGYNKRPFRMYKFRTMVADAERRQAELERFNEARGPVFKMRRDPRVTRLGAFLRKTSLDELPQLFNVLRGDLSLVGPRPLPRRDFERFDAHWFNRRFSVKPGLTCIWQVSGRSETSFDEWIRQDLEYIDRWSLALDLRILFKTIPAVLKGTGAV